MFLLFFLEEKFWWVEVIFFCLNKGVEYCNWDMGLERENFFVFRLGKELLDNYWYFLVRISKIKIVLFLRSGR